MAGNELGFILDMNLHVVERISRDVSLEILGETFSGSLKVCLIVLREKGGMVTQ